MANKLTQKEKMLLQDQKKHEGVCVQKYKKYAGQAQCPELKQLFTSYAEQELQHLNTINQILNEEVAVSTGDEPNQPERSISNMDSSSHQLEDATAYSSDAALCQDMLMTEKFVSGSYDTAIFEFTDSNVRQQLNHIQQEEQKHGEGIFNYMQSKGLYEVQ